MDNPFDLHLLLLFSGVCAGLDPHSSVEACGSRGGGPAGSGHHRGQGVWGPCREDPAAMWVRAAAS